MLSGERGDLDMELLFVRPDQDSDDESQVRLRLRPS